MVNSSSPNSVACRICGEHFSFSNRIDLLGAHLLDEHPEASLTHFLFCDDTGDGIRCDCNGDSNSGFILKKLFGRKSHHQDDVPCCKQHSKPVPTKKPSTVSRKKGLLKMTVEKWRPGTSPMSCPSCGLCAIPYVKHLRNKMTNNHVGAFFLFCCWPICFMPLLMAQSATVTLISCRKCGYCFGTYDQKSGKFTPARCGQ